MKKDISACLYFVIRFAYTGSSVVYHFLTLCTSTVEASGDTVVR